MCLLYYPFDPTMHWNDERRRAEIHRYLACGARKRPAKNGWDQNGIKVGTYTEERERESIYFSVAGCDGYSLGA